ncbi:uncharacterized protein BJ171DRAFT_276153 [Polychytrium aggregatum]|uniref:uncharacterized protein n=1 Tax=Polychytrium aggregatum TaxID=110093 RepID=UPI0022FECBA5|nr:uncharacterized protein BJ171DRAFT_276153 [Polychytrium aggregatum]KAI9207469.1 hypothetical protein BJ171DRAFT_276153 [Polychytrium aggregatum]
MPMVCSKSYSSIEKDDRVFRCCTRNTTEGALGRTRCSLMQRMVAEAEITTMEQKYSIVAWVAEFWCTMTSPLFGLPLIIYLYVPIDRIPLLLNVCILATCVCAVASTVYHMTNYRVFSAADEAFAVMTFYLNSVALNRHSPNSHSIWMLEAVWILPAAVILLLFIWQWETTGSIAVWLFALGLPMAACGFASVGCYSGLAFGCLGLLCFAADRMRFACLHSFWHLFGGVSLLVSISHTVGLVLSV